MTGYRNIAKHQVRRLVSKIIKLCSASRMTFRAWFYRTDPQNIGGQFGTLSGFLRNTFRKRTSQKKSPEMCLRPKSFRTIFEKRTLVYSFAAPLLGLAKSIYYVSYRIVSYCIVLYCIVAEPAGKARQRSSIAKEIW